MLSQVTLWVGFNLFVLAMLALDLVVFHRRAHVVEFRESLLWSAFWISLALLFNGGVYFWAGPESALEFLTGYLIELSLSVDNLFVFLLIFQYFAVPAPYQHKVLFWGILGAIVMRGVFIVIGVSLIERFHLLVYVFGAFLVWIGIRMALQMGKEIHPERSPVLRLFQRFVPLTDQYEGDKFFVARGGRRLASPLFVTLLAVETTDLIFALDSVPAIIAITRDPFIVYTSNVFAILGLRSLFFALTRVMQMFYYLRYALASILVFVGVKMLVAEVYKIPVGIALGVVAFILIISVIASRWRPPPATADPLPSNSSGDTGSLRS